MNNHKKYKHRPLWMENYHEISKVVWLGSRIKVSCRPKGILQSGSILGPLDGETRVSLHHVGLLLDMWWIEGIARMAVSCHPQIPVGGSWCYIFELFYISGIPGAIWIIRWLWPGASILRVHDSQAILVILWVFIRCAQWWVVDQSAFSR